VTCSHFSIMEAQVVTSRGAEIHNRKIQDRKMTDVIGLEFYGVENAGLEIKRPNGRFLKTFV